jgi:hypothetical protein
LVISLWVSKDEVTRAPDAREKPKGREQEESRIRNSIPACAGMTSRKKNQEKRTGSLPSRRRRAKRRMTEHRQMQ